MRGGEGWGGVGPTEERRETGRRGRPGEEVRRGFGLEKSVSETVQGSPNLQEGLPRRVRAPRPHLQLGPWPPHTVTAACAGRPNPSLDLGPLLPDIRLGCSCPLHADRLGTKPEASVLSLCLLRGLHRLPSTWADHVHSLRQ